MPYILQIKSYYKNTPLSAYAPLPCLLGQVLVVFHKDLIYTPRHITSAIQHVYEPLQQTISYYPYPTQWHSCPAANLYYQCLYYGAKAAVLSLAFRSKISFRHKRNSIALVWKMYRGKVNALSLAFSIRNNFYYPHCINPFVQ